ncbi:MAG: Mut7-C ubiquitin/RNAse domain-containing protein [Anaerolineae bacterium]|nr:Mut7-C ubiquitin/RNAse domain-containing protein [Anaerolineae bacterium]
MSQATFRFYAELNPFLSHRKRHVAFKHSFNGRQSIKDMIESLGVPHTEIDLILVNDESVDFSYLVQDGDQISVYPMFEGLDISPVQRLRPKPLRDVRFVLDIHLGKLAAYLRMLGFDTLYRNDYEDSELARVSRDDHRILLTRDRGLLKRSMVTHGHYVRETNPRRQLVEVVRHFDLFRSVEPFSRCVNCNGLLETVDKETVADQLMYQTRQHYDEFQRCTECGQIYWKGSHHQRMEHLIEHVLAQEPTSSS